MLDNVRPSSSWINGSDSNALVTDALAWHDKIVDGDLVSCKCAASWMWMQHSIFQVKVILSDLDNVQPSSSWINGSDSNALVADALAWHDKVVDGDLVSCKCAASWMWMQHFIFQVKVILVCLRFWIMFNHLAPELMDQTAMRLLRML